MNRGSLRHRRSCIHSRDRRYLPPPLWHLSYARRNARPLGRECKIRQRLRRRNRRYRPQCSLPELWWRYGSGRAPACHQKDLCPSSR
ncbi:Uncharacterised protein [Vibrio cholerae]|nr:Uncharacterised protein [Vibrio cholerae]